MINTTLWAINKNELSAINSYQIDALKNASIDIEPMETDDDTIEQESEPYQIVKGTAVIELVGVVDKYPSDMLEFFGGTSTLEVKNNLQIALNDPNISDIILYVDSPGGSVEGTSELAEAIAACSKPITAVVSDKCFSAAYWIASQADKIICNAGGFVGSIGVYQTLYDLSELYANAGIKVNVVKAGEFKAVGVEGTPITDDQIASEQKIIDAIYGQFVNTVAAGRGMNPADVKKLATGEIYTAADALKMGLIDEIGTMETVIMGNKITMETQVTPEAKVETPVETPKVEATQTIAEETKAIEANVEAPVAVVEEAKVVETPKADEKTTQNKAYEEGQKDTIERLNAVMKACGGRTELALQEFALGHDAAKARDTYAALLEEENKQLKAHKIGSGGAPIPVVGMQPRNENETDYLWDTNAGNCQAMYKTKAEFEAQRKWESKKFKK